MIFLRLLEYAVVILFIIFAVTQILIPLLRGKPIFPLFRKKEEIKEQLIVAKDETETAKLEKELEKEREKAKKLKEEKGKS